MDSHARNIGEGAGRRAWLIPGWNWVAKMLPWRTALVKGAPSLWSARCSAGSCGREGLGMGEMVRIGPRPASRAWAAGIR